MLEFSMPSCVSTGVCTMCGGCAFPKGIPAGKVDEYKPWEAPGQVATVLWETPGVATFYTGGVLHKPTVITYSFSGPTGANFNANGWLKSIAKDWNLGSEWYDLTMDAQLAISGVAKVISASTGVQLVFVSDPNKADMVWHYGDIRPSLGMTAAFNPDNQAIGSDIIVSTNFALFWETLDFNPGGKGFEIIFHEFGHAIGMKHPFFGNYQLAASLENRGTTMMSHTQNPNGEFNSTLRPLDQQALNWVYGTFADKAGKLGVAWSQLSGGGLVSIGNDNSNTIIGISDNDYIDGGGGNDTIYGNGGVNKITGGAGTNVIFGGNGADILFTKNMAANSFGNVIFWADVRSAGSLMGTYTAANAADHFSGIEYFSSIDYTLGNYKIGTNLSSPGTFVNQVYSLLLGRLPDAAAYTAGLAHISSASRVSFVEKILASAAFSQSTESQLDASSLVGTILSRQGGHAFDAQLAAWATNTGDIAALVTLVANGIQNNVKSSLDTSDFSYISVNEAYSLINSLAINNTSVNLSISSIAEYQYMIENQGSSILDIAETIVNSQNLSLSAVSLLTNAGITIPLPRAAVVYDLSLRDGSLGFTTRSDATAVGYVRASDITEFQIDREHIYLSLGPDKILKMGLTDKITLLDGVLLTSFNGDRSALIHIYEALTGKIVTSDRLAAIDQSLKDNDIYGAAVRSFLTDTSVSQEVGEFFVAQTNMNFVKSLYRILFDKEASAAELSSKLSLLDAGVRRQDLATEIAASVEVRDRLVAPDGGFAWVHDQYSDMVAGFYESAFNRLVEALPSDYTKQLKFGLAPNVIANAFNNSDEMRAIGRTSMNTDAFVKSQFQNAFGHQAPSAELTYWTDALTSGFKNRNDLLLYVVDKLVRGEDQSFDATGAAWSAVLNVPVAQSTPATASLHFGNIVRGASADFVEGSVWADTVAAGFGNDTVYTFGGADSIVASEGDDFIRAGSGDDTIWTTSGSDTIYGEAGNDKYILGNSLSLIIEGTNGGSDTITSSVSLYAPEYIETIELTGSANLYVVSNNIGTKIIGNLGSNLLIGYGGRDLIFGGNGNDRLFGGDGANELYGEDGIDYLVGGIDADFLNGGNDADEIHGGAGNDTILGGSDFATDILVAGPGNDWIDGGPAWDLMYGGTGDDTFVVSQQVDWVFEMPGEGNDLVIADSPNGYYLYANVENLRLLNNTPFGVGNSLDNSLIGSQNDNWLLGGVGNDTLDGKAGNDVLYGQGGSDLFIVGPKNGIDIIGDFDATFDRINFSGTSIRSFNDLQSRVTQHGADFALDLSFGDALIVKGSVFSTLRPENFWFS